MQSSIMNKVDRLFVLRDLAILNNNHIAALDNLNMLASKIIKTPVSLISMVAADHQFFKSHTGLPEPWRSRRQTPLSHSFCQHVVAKNQPLIVTDARENELLKDNKAIPDLNVIGYLGIPLTLSDGSSLGSFCVIDSEPHEWDTMEISIMSELAEIVIAEFEIRMKIRQRRASQSDLFAIHGKINELVDILSADMTQSEFLDALHTERDRLGL